MNKDDKEMKQKFNVITSTCVPIELENIDTDQIVPARKTAGTPIESTFSDSYCENGVSGSMAIFFSSFASAL